MMKVIYSVKRIVLNVAAGLRLMHQAAMDHATHTIQLPHLSLNHSHSRPNPVCMVVDILPMVQDFTLVTVEVDVVAESTHKLAQPAVLSPRVRFHQQVVASDSGVDIHISNRCSPVTQCQESTVSQEHLIRCRCNTQFHTESEDQPHSHKVNLSQLVALVVHLLKCNPNLNQQLLLSSLLAQDAVTVLVPVGWVQVPATDQYVDKLSNLIYIFLTN